ncbi:MAG: PEP-CTERM sorting domain-containing protein [Verrucomicrobia bacterium]|nr:PEP-CTERM sorting domain-containing protein [Verrucomicrobiota bacterium]
MKNIFKTAILASFMAVALATFATAGVIVAQENWDATGDFRGFGITEEIDSLSTAGLTVPAGFGNGASALRIDSDTTGDGGINIDRITATAPTTPGFLGPYNTIKTEYISFDFFQNVEPSGLQFLISANTFTWVYSIDTSVLSLGSWNQITVSMGDASGWVSPFAPFGTDFLTDVGVVTEIGFRISYPGSTAGQVYGFDNLTRYYQTPEPGTYAALSFALICLGITFRRKLQDSMSSTMKMLKS